MTIAGERVAARLRNLAFGSMIAQDTAFFDRNRRVQQRRLAGEVGTILGEG